MHLYHGDPLPSSWTVQHLKLTCQVSREIWGSLMQTQGKEITKTGNNETKVYTVFYCENTLCSSKDCKATEKVLKWNPLIQSPLHVLSSFHVLTALSCKGAAGFQIKIKQVNFNLHSRGHFAGGSSWNQCSYFRRVTVSRQHPFQWVPDVSQGFYMLPPCKLIIITRDKLYNRDYQQR